jgi:catechol 2,3-dioxygenase
MSVYHQGDAIRPVSLSLKIRNVDKSKYFYTEILGFTIFEETDDHIYYTINGKDIILKTLIDPNASPRQPVQGLYHVAYLLQNKNALAQLIYHIAKQKYPITGGANHGISDALYLDDPDGNGIELYVDTDPTYWKDIDTHPEKIANQPFDYDYYLSANPTMFKKIDSKTILGHMHQHTMDLKRSSLFYQKVFGYDLILNVHSAHFLSSNDYHHHLALNTWAKPIQAKANAVGLTDVTYVVGTDENLDKVMKNLTALNVPYEYNEGVIYTTDPDGVHLIVKK